MVRSEGSRRSPASMVKSGIGVQPTIASCTNPGLVAVPMLVAVPLLPRFELSYWTKKLKTLNAVPPTAMRARRTKKSLSIVFLVVASNVPS